MKNRTVVLVAACLLCVFWFSAGVARAEEADYDDDWNLTGRTTNAEKDRPGFDTPERAVAAYLDGLKNGDLEQMLAACATDIYMERRDFALLLSRMRGFPTSLIAVPNTNPFLRDIGRETRIRSLTQAILLQYVALLVPELTMGGDTLFFEDRKEIDEFRAYFGEERLGGLASLDILALEKGSEWVGSPETYRTQMNMDGMARIARTHGADGFENIVASFRVGGRQFLFFPMVCRYGDKWLITDLVGNVGNLLGVSYSTGGMMRTN